MEINYNKGPRILEDGTNLDADILASFPSKVIEQQISEPVTGLMGPGYEPGQKNADNTEL